MDELPRSFRTRLLGDEQLARLVTAGNNAAFTTLYTRYQRLLYRYCRSIVRSDADAHDAVQSTFARAFEALRRGQRDAPVRPWLYRIAHNESVTVIRARKAGDELSGYLTPHVARPEDRARDREQLGSLLDDLLQLPERPRGAILMRELSGLSHEEIASALGTSINGAKQAIFEARTALAEFAAGRSMACEKVREAISVRDRRALRGRRVSAHLRDCPACARFVAEFAGRTAPLRALWPPLLAATALLLRLGRAGPSVEAGAPAASAGLVGGPTNSLGAVIVTAKGVLVAAVLSAGVGSVGVHALQRAGRSASIAVRPAALISAPVLAPSKAAEAPHAKVGARRRPGSAVVGAPTSRPSGKTSRSPSASGGTRWTSPAAVPTSGNPAATTTLAPVARPTAAARSRSRGEPPRGRHANRGHGAGAGHDRGVSRPGHGPGRSGQAARTGHAVAGSHRAACGTSTATQHGSPSPATLRGHGHPAHGRDDARPTPSKRISDQIGGV